MTIRETTQLVTAHRQSEGGFIVRRPFPTSGLSEIDPFLLLDEMGPADYAPGEAVGAPDHPHRGFETVTYMLEGEFEHEDSAGHRGMIRPGDVQWMTAAGGIVHSEMPSRAIRDNGGHVHGFQLWVNLPACLKMSRPRYQEVPAAGIPEGRSADGRARVIAGEALGARAVIDTHIPIVYQDWSLDADADVTVAVAADTRAFVYVFRGAVQVGDRGTMVKDGQLALLGVGDAVRLRGTPEGGRFLLLAGLRSASGGTLRTFRHEHKRGAAAGRARLSNRKHGRNHTERANIMSWLQTNEPRCTDPAAIPAIEKVIEARSRDLGGFTVGRLLPSAARKLVGPFIFFDHMGPAELAPGQGLDVRPHPHINLATVTYLFEGEIVHRDSLGSEQPIRPGAINWMTAGRGIVHSERTGAQIRKTGSRVHGLQLWVALPQAREEDQPDFHHYPADTLPALDPQGARVRVLIGTAYGVTSPVRTRSPLFYADAQIRLGGELALPSEHAERAAYVVSGAISCGVERIEAARMIICAPGSAPVLRAETDARVMLIGGAPLDGERHIWWNFVSSSKERLEQVKREWKQGPVTSALEGRFPQVPGETEFIPLPKGL